MYDVHNYYFKVQFSAYHGLLVVYFSVLYCIVLPFIYLYIYRYIYKEDFAQQYDNCGARSGSPQLTNRVRKIKPGRGKQRKCGVGWCLFKSIDIHVYTHTCT